MKLSYQWKKKHEIKDVFAVRSQHLILLARACPTTYCTEATPHAQACQGASPQPLLAQDKG